MDKSSNQVLFYNEEDVGALARAGLNFLQSFAEVGIVRKSNDDIRARLQAWHNQIYGNPFEDDPEDDETVRAVILVPKARGETVAVDPYSFELARKALDFNIPCYVLRKDINQISWDFREVTKVDRQISVFSRAHQHYLITSRSVARHEIFNLLAGDIVPNKHHGGVEAPSFTPTPTLSAAVAYYYLNR